MSECPFIRVLKYVEYCTFQTSSNSASCLPRVLEPVDDVVDVQRLLPPPGLEGVEGGDVLLDLEAGGVVVLSEPWLQLRNLVLGVETYSHPGLVLVTQHRAALAAFIMRPLKNNDIFKTEIDIYQISFPYLHNIKAFLDMFWLVLHGFGPFFNIFYGYCPF